MIGRLLSDARDIVYALLAARELVRRQGELERDVVTLQEQVEDLDAITRELYVGVEPDDAEPAMCDYCREHPGRTSCLQPWCVTNRRPARHRHA